MSKDKREQIGGEKREIPISPPKEKPGPQVPKG